jgi:hypothetical protein
MKNVSIVALLALLAVTSCGNAPLVAQGKVIRYEAAARSVVLDNEKAPGQQMLFSLTGADVGAEPEVGDMIRVAYRDEGGKLVALRVMNLSKQAELAKKGH